MIDVADMRIAIRLVGAALLAAFVLAPGAARAANECGALNSGNSFTEDCPAAAYANGIVYWNQANAVTLTVPGTATTTTITAPTNTGFDIGIVVGTATHASARNIALTVGGTGTSVDIVQASGPQANLWYRNTGIIVRQRSGGEATTTVDVKSGVTIGTSATGKMNNRGIDVNVEAAGAGAVSVTSGATIYSENDGIQVFSAAAGAVTVTNSGAITTDGRGVYVRGWNVGSADAIMLTNSGAIKAGGEGINIGNAGTGAIMLTNSGAIASDARGIHVEDTGSAGGVTVASSGAITADDDGIWARTTGKDAANTVAGVSIAHSAGAIAAEGGGIEAHVGAARQETDTEHADYVEPMNAGLAKVAVTGGSVSSTSTAIRAVNYEAGSVEVSVSEGVTLTSATGGGIDAVLTDAGNPGGTITVTQAGTIRAAKGGIAVVRYGGAGTVSVTNSGAIEAGDDGIFVVARGGGGAVTVTNSGALGTAVAPVARGIFASYHDSGAAGGVTVTNSGAITATDHGILAQTRNRNAAAGANVGVTVTHSAGAIVVASDEAIDDGAQGVKEGIVVRVGNHRAETDADHADYVRPVNAGLAKAAVTGGSVTSKGNAVEVANYEAGGVEIDVSAGVELTSTHDQGIEADLRDVGNKGGTIKITQGGAVSAAKNGLSAGVAWAGGAGPDRAIDIAWTGTFASRASQRAPLANIGRALGAARSQILDDLDIHYAQGYAGIDAGVMKLEPLMDAVAASDDPGAFADAAAVTALFADGADAATRARAAAIVAQFKAVLENEDLGTIPGADDIDADDDGTYSDAEITAYLSADDDRRRTLLRDILATSFTDEEKAVLQALLAGDGVSAALDDASFSAEYKAAVRALAGNHNTGDIRVAMNGGSIDSSGDGIRAWFATPHAMNGGISISVAAGATVEGDMAGIYAANAGTGLSVAKKYTSPAVQNENDDLGADDLVTLPDYLDQVVMVQGTVTGGSDAAVHLAGGGALIVTGAGKLVAGSSGRAVLVNDPGPAVIYIEGEVTGGEGPEGTPAPAAVHLTGGGSVTVGLTGRVRAGGAMSAIRGDNAPTAVIVHSETLTREAATEALARIEGGIVGDGIEKSVTIAEVRDDGTTGHALRDLPVGEDGVVDVSSLPRATFSCGEAMDGRCRLYEALPSVLLAMNGLPTYGERLAAARSESGGWARVETSRGEWQADGSTLTGIAYDHDRNGVRAGVDMAVGEDARLGISMHGLRGEAEMAQSGGKVELSGMGVGVSATTMAGEVYIDAQVQATWFDVEVTSGTGVKLKDGVGGEGYALALEAGRPMALNESLSLTPSLGLAWSRVSLDDFTDEVGSGARVSVEDADSLVGRLGLAVAADTGGGLRLFGSMDAMQEFSEETEARVSGTQLQASAKASSVRLGLGGVHSWGEGRYAVQGSASYTAAGGDNSAFGGGLSLSMSF